MDPRIETVIQDYEARAASEEQRIRNLNPAEAFKHVDEFLLPIGRATGTVLNVLIKEAKAKRILEIGTSYGYSTVWLAEAAAETGGKVISMELRPAKIDYAKQQLARAGLAQHVEFHVGDALAILKALSGQFDFVLLDLFKELYVPCLDIFYPRLKPGALIAADNMLEPEFSRPASEAYRQYVHTKKDISSILLPLGSGIELSRYK
jgi:predicted O-methyltransferase YrrM